MEGLRLRNGIEARALTLKSGTGVSPVKTTRKMRVRLTNRRFPSAYLARALSLKAFPEACSGDEQVWALVSASAIRPASLSDLVTGWLWALRSTTSLHRATIA